MEEQQEKVTSAGILIQNRTGEYLQCHCTGKKKGSYMTYDIPKGQVEGSESHLQTMLRELWEETGIDWRGDKDKITRIFDFGVLPYTSFKDLHVFYILVDDGEIDPTTLKCNSFFTANFGGRDVALPEVNGFQFSDNVNYFYKPLQQVLERLSSKIAKIRS